MTIEFESQGSRLLAVSVPNKTPYAVSLAIKEVPKHWRYDVIGFSEYYPGHHEAMKEAGIYHVNPYSPLGEKRFKSDDTSPQSQQYHHDWHKRKEERQEAQNRTSECWILLKIK